MSDLFERGKPFLLLSPEQIKLTDSLRSARGKRFVSILKEAYYSIAPVLNKEARNIIANTGTLNLKDVIKLSIKFNLHLKHCVDFLSDPLDPVISFTWNKMDGYRNVKPMKWREEILTQMEIENNEKNKTASNKTAS